MINTEAELAALTEELHLTEEEGKRQMANGGVHKNSLSSWAPSITDTNSNKVWALPTYYVNKYLSSKVRWDPVSPTGLW